MCSMWCNYNSNEWMGMHNGIFINFELEKWIGCFGFYMKVDE